MADKVFSLVSVTVIILVIQVASAIAADVKVEGGRDANANVILVEKSVDVVAQRKCVEMCLRYGTIIFEGSSAKSGASIANKDVKDLSNDDVNSVKNMAGDVGEVLIGGVEKVMTDLESTTTTTTKSSSNAAYNAENSGRLNGQWSGSQDLSYALHGGVTTSDSTSASGHYDANGEMKTSTKYLISNGDSGELHNATKSSSSSGLTTTADEKVVSSSGSNTVTSGRVFQTGSSSEIRGELKQSGKEGAYYSQSNKNNNKDVFHETLRKENTGSWSAEEFNSKSNKDSSFSSTSTNIEDYSDSRNSDFTSIVDNSRKIANTATTSRQNEESVGALFVGGDYGFITTDANKHTVKTNTESAITSTTGIKDEATNSETSTTSTNFTTDVKNSEFHTTGINTITESTKLALTTGIKTTMGEIKYSDSLSSNKNREEMTNFGSTIEDANKMTERITNTASTTMGTNAINRKETKSGVTTQVTNKLEEELTNSKSTLSDGNLITGNLNIHSATSTTSKNVNTTEVSNSKFITTSTNSNTIIEQEKGLYGGMSEKVTISAVGESTNSQSNVLHGTLHNQFTESRLAEISGSKTHENSISTNANTLGNQNKEGSYGSVQDNLNSGLTTLHNQSATKTTNLASTTTMHQFESGEMKTSVKQYISNGEIRGDSSESYNAAGSSAISGFETKTEKQFISTSGSDHVNKGDFHTAFSGGIQGELKQSGKEEAYYSQSNMNNNKDVFHETLREGNTGSLSATEFNSKSNKDSSFTSSTATIKEYSDSENSNSATNIDNSRKTVNSGISSHGKAESGSILFVGEDSGFIATDANKVTAKTNTESFITGTNRIQEEVTNSETSSTSTNKFTTDRKMSNFITTGTNTVIQESMKSGSTGIQTTMGETNYHDSFSSNKNENTQEMKSFGASTSTNRIAEKTSNSGFTATSTIRLEDQVTNSETSTSGIKTETSNSKFITTGSNIIPAEETNYISNNIVANSLMGEVKHSEFASSNNAGSETTNYNSNNLNNGSSKGGYYWRLKDGSNSGSTTSHHQSTTETNFSSTTVHHDTTEINNSGTQLLKNGATTGFHGGMSGGVKMSGGWGSSNSQSKESYGTLHDEIPESGSAAIFSSKTHKDSSSSYSSSSSTSVEKEHLDGRNSDSASINTNSRKTVNTGLDKTETGGGQLALTAEQTINKYGSTTNYNRKENTDNVKSISENNGGDRVIGLLYGTSSNPSTVNSGWNKLYTSTDSSFNSESHHTINQNNRILWFGKDRSDSGSNTIHNGVQTGLSFRQGIEQGSVTNSGFTNSNTVKEKVSNVEALTYIANKNAGQVISSGFHDHVVTESTGGLSTYSESISNAANTIARKETVSGSTNLFTNENKGDLTKSVFMINGAKTITGEITNTESNTSNSFNNAGSYKNYESKTVFGGNSGSVSDFHAAAVHNGHANRVGGLGSGFYHWGIGNGLVITPSRFATPCQT